MKKRWAEEDQVLPTSKHLVVLGLLCCAFLAGSPAAAAPPCKVTGLPDGPVAASLWLELDQSVPLRYTIVSTVRDSPLGQDAIVVGPLDYPRVRLKVPMTSEERQLDVTIIGTTATGEETLWCLTRATLQISAFAPAVSVADRVVVPVAGTVSGANGSRWRTSLQLIGFATGTIYFRPAGTFHGDDRDPHIYYHGALASVVCLIRLHRSAFNSSLNGRNGRNGKTVSSAFASATCDRFVSTLLLTTIPSSA